MSNRIKKIKSIKNHTYCFFNKITNVRDFYPNNIKTDEISTKKILIQYIEYVMKKDLKYLKINSVNLLYLVFSKVNR